MEPPDHRAQAYTDEDFLATVVADYVAAGLARRDAVVLIATPAHTKAFVDGLTAARVNVDAAMERRQLLFLDAADALGRFMVAGAPEREAFGEVVADAVGHVRAGGYATVRLYGEVVDLLWEDDREAALRLEEFWNEVLEDRRLSLLCAYRLSPFDRRVRDFLGQMARYHAEVALLPQPEAPAAGAAAVFALRELPRRTPLSARRPASRSRRTR